MVIDGLLDAGWIYEDFVIFLSYLVHSLFTIFYFSVFSWRVANHDSLTWLYL